LGEAASLSRDRIFLKVRGADSPALDGHAVFGFFIRGRPTALLQAATQLFSHPLQNRFLSMKPIFSLIEDRPGMLFKGLLGNFLAAVCR
jgi:hypothetical protein